MLLDRAARRARRVTSDRLRLLIAMAARAETARSSALRAELVATRAGRARCAARRLRLAARRLGGGGRGAAGADHRDCGSGGNRRGARDPRRTHPAQRRVDLGLRDPGLGLFRRHRLRRRRLLARRRPPLRRGPPLRQPRQLPPRAAPARALGDADCAHALHGLADPDRDLRREPLPHRRTRLGAGRPGLRGNHLRRVRVERRAARDRRPQRARVELEPLAGDRGAGGGRYRLYSCSRLTSGRPRSTESLSNAACSSSGIAYMCRSSGKAPVRTSSAYCDSASTIASPSSA